MVSGIFNTAANMYIPAPPSPTPDYDDETAVSSDGGELDILNGSQFYVVGPSQKKSKDYNGFIESAVAKNKNNFNKYNNGTSKANISTAVVEVHRNNSAALEKKRNSVSSDDSKRGSLSDDSLKDTKTSRSNGIKSHSSSNASSHKASSPLEKMMTKFHESLPPLSKMDETHFSDDSLEDSTAEDASSILTSKPSTIDPKSFWNDSVDSTCSANESAASFDYITTSVANSLTQSFAKNVKSQAKKQNINKMARTNSQSDSSNRWRNNNAKESSKVNRNCNVNEDRTSQSKFHVPQPRNVRADVHEKMNPNEERKYSHDSTCSSDSAKFDTIKNMLKEGLIEGLDEKPPDFIPPPPFPQITDNVSSLSNKIDSRSRKSSHENRKSHSSVQENSDLSSSNPRDSSATRSPLRTVANKLFSNKEKNNQNGERSMSVTRDDSHRRSRERSNTPQDSIIRTSLTEKNRTVDAEDSPPPLPPPRESSLQTTIAKAADSNWLHGTRLPSLKNKKSTNKPPTSDKSSSNPSSRRHSALLDNEHDQEMIEVSIYAKSYRDGDKITHVDDFGNEIQVAADKNIDKFEESFDADSLCKERSGQNNHSWESNKFRNDNQNAILNENISKNTADQSESHLSHLHNHSNEENNYRCSNSGPSSQEIPGRSQSTTNRTTSASPNVLLNSSPNPRSASMSSVPTTGSKKRQPPPPPPDSLVTQSPTKHKTQTPTPRIFSQSVVSQSTSPNGRNHPTTSVVEDGRRYSKEEQVSGHLHRLESPKRRVAPAPDQTNSTLPPPATSEPSQSSQELRRATSMVLTAPNKKGNPTLAVKVYLFLIKIQQFLGLIFDLNMMSIEKQKWHTSISKRSGFSTDLLLVSSIHGFVLDRLYFMLIFTVVTC